MEMIRIFESYYCPSECRMSRTLSCLHCLPLINAYISDYHAWTLHPVGDKKLFLTSAEQNVTNHWRRVTRVSPGQLTIVPVVRCTTSFHIEFSRRSSSNPVVQTIKLYLQISSPEQVNRFIYFISYFILGVNSIYIC